MVELTRIHVISSVVTYLDFLGSATIKMWPEAYLLYGLKLFNGCPSNIPHH